MISMDVRFFNAHFVRMLGMATATNSNETITFVPSYGGLYAARGKHTAGSLSRQTEFPLNI